MCDQISDALVDEALRQDPESRVAIETGTKNGGVMVFGEMTTKGYIDVPRIVRQVNFIRVAFSNALRCNNIFHKFKGKFSFFNNI